MLILLIVTAVIVVLLLIRWIRLQPQEKRWRYYLYLLGTVFVGLALSGRLHWLVAAAAAALPLGYKLFALLRWTPLLLGVYHRIRAGRAGYDLFKSANASPEVIQNLLKRLANLGENERRVLIAVLRQKDPQAASFVEAYFARRAQGSGTRPRTSNKNITTKEAYQILGLRPGATRDEVVDAHRKLIQKFHPDRGGTPYMAAMINDAKQHLLAQL